MKKLMLVFALLVTLAALLPIAALGSPGRSTGERNDNWTTCGNGHGFTVYKDDDGTCGG